MTKTFHQIDLIATACMASADKAVEGWHRVAASSAETAREGTFNERQAYRLAEGEALLKAVSYHAREIELTTSERLLAAAIIAARATGEPLFTEIEPETTDNKRQSGDAPLPFDVDSEGTNDNRADWAAEAVAAFQAATGADDDEAIGDLVADLAHLCDREGERFGWSVRDQIERGLRAYEQEITDEEPEEIEAAEVVGAN